ncbi:MAG: hypothetical protein ABF649_09290 [Bacillus sp. (in: firmicutes)]
MGYILPITNYQYEQYALREIGRKTNPYKQQEIPRIVHVDNRLQDLHDETKEQKGKVYPARQMNHPTNQMHENKVKDSLIAKLTGKGENFHAFV